MARMLYGGTPADYTATAAGRLIPNASVEVWTDVEGGTQVTDLLDYDGNAVTVATSDNEALLRFYGPDGENDTLYIDSGQGARLAIKPMIITASIADGSILDEDINAAADIDPSKVAGTALTAESTGVFSVLDYGADPTGTDDSTDAIQDTFDAAGDGIVLFPAGYTFAVTSIVPPTSGVTVLGYGATIKGTVKHVPIFDIVMLDDVTILGLSFLTEESRAYTGGESVRLNDVYAMWAGVLASGARLTVRDCTFTGFTCGVSLYTWNGTNRTGSCVGATIADCTMADNDFGVLAETASDLTISGITGTYSAQTGSPNPAHLVYLSKGNSRPDNANVSLRNIHGYDSEGHCIQVKHTNGGTITGVQADGCAGILSLKDATQLHISGITATNDTCPTSGSVYCQEAADIADIVLSDVLIHSVASTAAGARAGRIAGSRVTARNLTSLFDWAAQDEAFEWATEGTDIKVSAVTSLNRSAYGAWVVSADGTRIDVSDVTAVNCRGAVKYQSAATGALTLNLDKITTGSSISSPYKYYVTTPAGVAATIAGGAVGSPAQNLLTANQADLGTDTTGWTGYHAAISRSTVAAYRGSASLLFAIETASPGTVYTPNGTSGIPVTAGRSYSWEFWVKAAVNTPDVRPVVEWDDAAGGTLSQSEGSYVTSTSSWQRYFLNVTAPASAAFASPRLTVSGSVADAAYGDAFCFWDATRPDVPAVV